MAATLETDSLLALVKKGIIAKKALKWLEKEAFSERYGWLPSEIAKERAYDLQMYRAVISGRAIKQERLLRKSEAKRRRM